jgi:hypothetical protein
MRITRTFNWNRRDFSYEAECEGCGHKQTNKYGYDDANYYENVVPNEKCDKCGKSRIDIGAENPSFELKHDPNAVI